MTSHWQSGPPPGSIPGVAPTFPPPVAIPRHSQSTLIPRPVSPYEQMLQRIELYVDPPSWALKAGIPPVDSFVNRLARLCLYSLDVQLPERRKILSFVRSKLLHGVIVRTVSVAFHLDAAKRLKATKDFNDLVEQVIQAFGTWCCSWNATPRRDISPMEAAKQLSQEAFSVHKQTDVVPWDIVVFVFGRAPELWGLGPCDSSGRSIAESSGAQAGGKGKAPEIPHAAPLAQLEERFAVADAEPMAVDDEALDPSQFVPHPVDSISDRRVYPSHLGSNSFRPEPVLGAAPQAMGSGEGTVHHTTSAPGFAPTSEAQTMDTTAGVSAVPQSTPRDDLTPLLQHQDLTTFLSAYGLLALLPGSELSTLLHDALEYKEDFKGLDHEELKEAMAEVLRQLHIFRQVHGESVSKVWRLVRQARQWHTWGLEVQFFYEKLGVFLSPEALAGQRKLFAFINGYTILILQLTHQQAGFQPPAA